jgi:hypothetical protein
LLQQRTCSSGENEQGLANKTAINTRVLASPRRLSAGVCIQKLAMNREGMQACSCTRIDRSGIVVIHRGGPQNVVAEEKINTEIDRACHEIEVSGCVTFESSIMSSTYTRWPIMMA